MKNLNQGESHRPNWTRPISWNPASEHNSPTLKPSAMLQKSS